MITTSYQRNHLSITTIHHRLNNFLLEQLFINLLTTMHICDSKDALKIGLWNSTIYLY